MKLKKILNNKLDKNLPNFLTQKNRTKINCLEKCFDNKATNDL